MVHPRNRSWLAGMLVAVAVGAAAHASVPAVAAPARPETSPRTPAKTFGLPATVTLVTGDVVTLGGVHGADVRPAPGREHVAFHLYTDPGGDVHVVPADAVGMLSSGRLDARLFDVTGLAKDGYDDAHRKDVPLIVDYAGATPKGAVRALPSVRAVALSAAKGPDFWTTARTSARRIWLDGRVRASLDQSVPQIRAPEAWAAGHTGAGATVAVLDSGIDTTHPDLDDAVIESRDFTGSEHGADDYYGHGTHVASIITGDGPRYKGVAPDAKLRNGKVLDDYGDGYESEIIAGMEWAAHSGADVVNMSLGWSGRSDGTDPVALAVDNLTAETGALFVVAAGNDGPDSIGTPAAADAALTVGAVDRNDQLASFSSTGPRLRDGAIKPDITAPGVGIVAAKAAHGVVGDDAGDGYVSLSGTSMAAPHVAGAAAILAGEHPDWTAGRLKAGLMATAKPNPDLSVFQQGAGRVDVAAATSASVTSSPASLNLGLAQWPHDDDQPITNAITYTNSGAEPVTLDLTPEIKGPDGKAAPAGMFTLSATRVTVPAGGSAQVSLTADTRGEHADGTYAGTVVAAGGDRTLRTPVSLRREVESYDVTLDFVDQQGKPTANYVYILQSASDAKQYDSGYGSSPTLSLRVPKGDYALFASQATDSGSFTDFVEPKIAVDGPVHETLDARDGKPIGFTVDKPEARVGRGSVDYTFTADWGKWSPFLQTQDLDKVRIRPSRTSAPGRFEFLMEGFLAKPDNTPADDGDFYASPYLYNLRLTDDSRVPANLRPHYSDRQLAKVVSSYALASPDSPLGWREFFLLMPLPATLTEYYTPGTGWYKNFMDGRGLDDFPNFGIWDHMGLRSYRLGQTTKERWNAGVFGPGMYNSPIYPYSHAARLGDDVLFEPSPYSSQNVDSEGSSFYSTDVTQVLRDGKVIDEQTSTGGIITHLPPDEATYTVRSSATLARGPLSTQTDAEWTFRSAHVDGDTPRPIPALVVRFAPNLDDHNTAPAGRKFSFPVYVQRNAADRPGKVNTPTVEISYDDGATWRPVCLVRDHDQWRAEVDHPGNAKFASLRWSVSDPDGNTAKATTIHAYALR